MTLTLAPNLRDADGTYERLVKAHEGLTTEESVALNARLILILANHIDDLDVLDAALEAAAMGESRSPTGN